MTSKPKPEKAPKDDRRVSLAPLSTEEALRDLMATGRPEDEDEPSDRSDDEAN